MLNLKTSGNENPAGRYMLVKLNHKICHLQVHIANGIVETKENIHDTVKERATNFGNKPISLSQKQTIVSAIPVKDCIDYVKPLPDNGMSTNTEEVSDALFPQNLNFGDELSPVELRSLLELLARSWDGFAVSNAELSESNFVQHTITMDGSLVTRKIIKEQIQEILDAGINVPSCSPYSSLFVVVCKKTTIRQ